MKVSSMNGVVPILPTPFNVNEKIDEEGFETMFAFIKKAGCPAIGVPAFGSEFYKLSGDERTKILDIVFKYTGDTPVIVQCNHVFPGMVEALVKDAENRGASAINTALPRIMPVSENQLLAYARSVCRCTKLPVIIQDYNPGGSVIGIDFVKKLSDECENFRYIKYELPGIGPLINSISAITSGKIKVFSGWGGSYMLELIPAGIAGIMPGISLVDYFIKIWDKAGSGSKNEAMKMFAAISPYLSFSLQHLEMFHHAEKRLAVRRGIIKLPVVRSVSVELDDFQDKYLELLLDQTCGAIERYGLKVMVMK